MKSESYETESDSCFNNYEIDKKLIKQEKDSSLLLTFISKENINRCWRFFSDIMLYKSTISNFAINYKLNKGNNTFNVGNEFSCYWIGISKIYYKCLESKNNYGIRKLSWKIDLDIGYSLLKTYTIYPITSNSQTLIKLKFELICPEKTEPINLEESKDYLYKSQYKILEKISNLMEKSSKYLFIQESFIVNSDFENCWRNMTDLNFLSKLSSGIIGENFVFNGDKERVGTFGKCYIKNYNKYFFFRVKNISKRKKRNKWTYCLETFGANICLIRQEVEISVTKINNNKSQIAIFIKFRENIDKNFLEYKKIKLLELIKKIKLFVSTIRD